MLRAYFCFMEILLVFEVVGRLGRGYCYSLELILRGLWIFWGDD